MRIELKPYLTFTFSNQAEYITFRLQQRTDQMQHFLLLQCGVQDNDASSYFLIAYYADVFKEN